MSAEIIRITTDGTMGFGDYTLTEKTKIIDFPFQGDLYKVDIRHMHSYLVRSACLKL